MKYYIVRTYSAGVFFAQIIKRDGKETVMTQSRRIWYWEGAASLSQLAMEGTSKPENCKFPCVITTEHIVTETIEVIECTKKAIASLQAVPVWAE